MRTHGLGFAWIRKVDERMQVIERNRRIKKLTLIGLEVLFMLIIVSVAMTRPLITPPVWLMVAFALATLRMSHTISFNEVAEWLREPFCYVKQDSCKAGADVHARTDRTGFHEAIGGLLSCASACSSTWSALILYSTWILFPRFGTMLVLVLAFAGGSEVLHYLSQSFEWKARESRVISGKICPDEE